MPLRATRGTPLCALAAVLACLAAPARAQDPDRIWARVHTTGGEVHTGFIRWDRREASWGDVLDGAKTLPDENYFAWLEAHDRERATRTMELRGYRISWYEVDPDFPMQVLSGVRFGHLDSLVVLASDRVELTLRSGRSYELEARGSNLGPPLREVVVDVPDGDAVELDWDELERVVFSAPPPDAVPGSRRLHGSVEDRSGNRFTGYLAWDLDEAFESDVLDGREMRRPNDREIPFERIRSLTRIPGGTRVEYTDGGTIDLQGGRDVDEDNRGVQVADPGLGVVVVPWDQLRAVRFHAPGGTGTAGRFDGGCLLAGTVATREGEEIDGDLRWDADEAGSWEILDGVSGGTRYHIELGFVRRIAPGDEEGARVTLADGRMLELSGSRDVDPEENKGVMVTRNGRDSATGDGPSWRLIPWSDIAEVRFRSDPPTCGPEDGR